MYFHLLHNFHYRISPFLSTIFTTDRSLYLYTVRCRKLGDLLSIMFDISETARYQSCAITCALNLYVHGKWSQPLLSVGWRGNRRKLTVIGITNRLIYCVIFIVYTQFLNVAASRIIQPSGPRVWDPYCIIFRSLILSSASALISHTKLSRVMKTNSGQI